MSCHNIGRGINTITEKIIKYYDEDAYTTDVARALLATARRAVNWCDGNEDEAIASIRNCRCGRCLKKMQKGEHLFYLWHSSKLEDVDKIIDGEVGGEAALATDRLCAECFERVVSKNCGECTGKREMEYIMRNMNKEEYTVE